MTVLMARLRMLIKEQKNTSFVFPDDHPDEKALGILVAHFCRWDGNAILEVAAAALQDANFEDAADRVAEMAL